MGDETFDYPTMARALILGDRDTVARKTREGLDLSLDPKVLIFKGLIPGMDVVGEKFRRNEYYVPQVLLSARAMYAGLDLLKPLITASARGDDYLGIVVIGTAQGDLHDIGKNLVAMMLEGAGFKVVNLGRDVAPEVFVNAVGEHSANIVGISALMTTTMPAMKRTIDALIKAGLRERVKVMVGGAPVSQAFADEIGADGYAKDSTAGRRQGQGARRGRGRPVKARGWEVVERVRDGETLVFDGGYGTMLFAAGLANGACPELWNDTHAEVVRGIHRGYFDAGSQIVETNTFGGTRLKLNEYKIGDRTRDLNEKGARLARAAAPRSGYIAGSIGPTSRLPLDYALDEGVTDEEYVDTFREQAEALAEGGVDLFAVETMMFPQECTAAVRACKAVADLPVMATMFFQYEEIHDRDRTMWGESPAEVAKNLVAAGADVIGMNCGRGPDRAIVIIREMRQVTDAPLVAYPNAGLPITTGDTVTYELGPEEMAREYPALLDVGCNIVGACCGSNPEHIRRIAEIVSRRRPPK